MTDGTPNPHPTVVVIRALWQIFMGLFFLGAAFALGTLILDGRGASTSNRARSAR